MKDLLPVITVESLPAKIRLRIESPVSREVRAVFYRRGSEDALVSVPVSKDSTCEWSFSIPQAVKHWDAGRYEVRIQTSAKDIAWAAELRFGTVLKVSGGSLAGAECGGGCCV